eukprot:1012231-Rhodomonas_salina.1
MCARSAVGSCFCLLFARGVWSVCASAAAGVGGEVSKVIRTKVRVWCVRMSATDVAHRATPTKSCCDYYLVLTQASPTPRKPHPMNPMNPEP